MTPVDQDRELDHARAPEIDERVERGADRPSGEQHVVHEDDGLALDRERDVGPAHHRRAPHGEIVAIERDVERADREVAAVNLRDLRDEAMGERDAPGPQADERDVGTAGVLLEDLVRDAGEGAVESGFVENLGFLSEARIRAVHLLSLPASRGPLKGKTVSSYATLPAGVGGVNHPRM